MKLIVDMPMPVKEWNCLDCKAICADLMRGHYCGITKKTIDTLKNMRARPDWCPIKGVLPEKHGDLIDIDVAIQTFKCIEEAPYSEFDGQEAFYTPEDVVNTLLCQDVVIKAERIDDDK